MVAGLFFYKDNSLLLVFDAGRDGHRRPVMLKDP